MSTGVNWNFEFSLLTEYSFVKSGLGMAGILSMSFLPMSKKKSFMDSAMVALSSIVLPSTFRLETWIVLDFLFGTFCYFGTNTLEPSFS